MELEKLLKQIEPENAAARESARRHWNSCAKPLGGLGLLETALEDIAALTGSADIDIRERAVLVLCADNGVVCQGVTQSPSSVTAIVTENLAASQTSVCHMARTAGCRVVPVDMGVLDFPEMPGVLSRRVGNGTADIAVGPAMTRAQAEQAVLTGIELVREQAEQGVKLLATGEMGIGNTTTSSAVLAVLLDAEVEAVTGRGGGITDEGFRKKKAAIAKAIAVNRPDKDDVVDVLSKVGGFDLAGLCGAFLGGAVYHVPILIDGLISAAAALAAATLCPTARDYMLASHLSGEPAGWPVLNALGVKPILPAGMRLGEGTGAVAVMPILDMAMAVYNGDTFADINMEAYTPQS